MTAWNKRGNCSPARELRLDLEQSVRNVRHATDRRKLGTKRHILTDPRGTPLSAIVTGALVHDMKATMETLDSIVAERPSPRPYHLKNLCLHKGYDFQDIGMGAIERGYLLTLGTRARTSRGGRGGPPLNRLTRVRASTRSVFTFAEAIAFVWIGLERITLCLFEGIRSVSNSRGPSLC